MPSQRASSSSSARASAVAGARASTTWRPVTSASAERPPQRRTVAGPRPRRGLLASAVPEATASKQPTAPQKQRAPVGDGHVADSAGQAAAAVQQPAIDDDAAADPGRYSDEDQRPARPAPRRSATRRWPPRCRRSRGRPAGRAARKYRGQREVLPSRQRRDAMTMPACGSSGPGAETPMPAIAHRRRGTDHSAEPSIWPIDGRRPAADGVGSAAQPRTAPPRRPARRATPCRRDRCRARPLIRLGLAAHAASAMRAGRFGSPKASEPEHDRLRRRRRAAGARVCARMPPSAASTTRCGRPPAARAPRAAGAASASRPWPLTPMRVPEQRQHATSPRKGRERRDRRVQLEHDARPRAELAREPRQRASASPFSAWTLIRSAPASANWRDLADEHQPRPSDGHGAAWPSARRSARRGRERTEAWREMAVGDVDMIGR